MAPRMVIADSDDEDNGISPLPTPNKPVTPAVTQANRSSELNLATGSTDTAFFQAVYNEQQDAAFGNTGHDVAESGAAIGGVSSSLSASEYVRRKTNAINSSSLTSVTDPASGSRRLNPSKTQDSVGLTQVTTPGRRPRTGLVGPWEVPSSPETSNTWTSTRIVKAKTPKTNPKRKPRQSTLDTSPPILELLSPGPTQQPAGEQQEINDEDTSPLPLSAAKRQKRGSRISANQTQEEVDMILVPRSMEVNGGHTTAHVRGIDDSSGIVQATMLTEAASLSLCIGPSVLSASQKLQYQAIDVPSDEPIPHTSLEIPSNQATINHKSSGATTIAYTTPSQYKSSGPLLPPLGETPVKSDTGKRKRTLTSLVEPSSSPDVISASDIRQRKRSRIHGNTGEQALNDEPWGSDDAGFHHENYIPRVGRRRSGARYDHGSDESLVDELVPEVLMDNVERDHAVPDPSDDMEELPKLKKRGRKKKANRPETVAVEANTSDVSGKPRQVQATISEAQGAAPPTQQKRKRGRPRKSDNAVAASVEQMPDTNSALGLDDDNPPKIEAVSEAEADSDSHIDSPIKPSKPRATKSKKKDNKKQKKGPAAQRSAGQGEGHKVENPRALQEVPANQASTLSSSKLDIVTPAGGIEGFSLQTAGVAKEMAKQGATGSKDRPMPAASQVGKTAVYRVGLSKKSRIAPLLKCLRK